jgi:hypothetical protein
VLSQCSDALEMVVTGERTLSVPNSGSAFRKRVSSQGCPSHSPGLEMMWEV